MNRLNCVIFLYRFSRYQIYDIIQEIMKIILRKFVMIYKKTVALRSSVICNDLIKDV